MAEKEEAPTKLTKGGKNLIILGVAAIIVAAVTTGVSLVIYHNSGDIYLDRSRPGFLPDKEEISNDGKDESEYVFPKNGALTPQILDEYLERLEIEIKAIDAYEKPFGENVLSDENLGIWSEVDQSGDVQTEEAASE
ncbi:hypothetical protein IKF34_03025 [Candidatus Saccharibacteria bacterium]|nr:hypothetical protein [Candidatus Saccharibacteria bacterium]